MGGGGGVWYIIKYAFLFFSNWYDCWLIESDSPITLNFTLFDVEEETDCGYDFVKVYDGASKVVIFSPINLCTHGCSCQYIINLRIFLTIYSFE